MSFPYERTISVGLEHLDEMPGPYCMSFHFDLCPLKMSMERFGVTNPPFVSLSDMDTIEIVTGYRRIMALRSLGMEMVSCVDLSHQDLSSLDLLLFNLYDNIPTRSFNHVEKGMILSRLLQHFSVDEVLEKYMPLLGLPSYEDKLNILVQLQDMDHELKVAVAEERLSLKTISFMSEMEMESRVAMLHLIKDLNLNFNYQVQFIELINDICNKNDLSVSFLLKEDPIRGIMEESYLNTPQKTRKILEFLKKSRNPTIIRVEESFRRKVELLRLPKGVKVTPPPFFESPDWDLQVSFRNGVELRNTLLFLAKLEHLEGLTDF